MNRFAPKFETHPRRPRDDARGGFTLLEMIVALAIVAVMAGVLAASMQIAYRAKASAEATVEPGRSIGVTMDFLRSDLQCAMPPTGTLASSFVGTTGQDDRGRDGDDLIFYTTADGPMHENGNGEIKLIELTVQTASNGDHVLLRRVTSLFTPLTQNQVDPDEEVLCRGVAGFNLRYFDGSVWQESWDSTQQTNQLPLAVEVTIGLERPGSQGQNPIKRYVRTFNLPASTLSSSSSGGLTQ